MEDHCAAINLVLHRGKVGEIYNIGGNNEKKNIEVVYKIINYLHHQVDPNIDHSLIRYVEDRKGHDRRYAIDATKIKNELGWRPAVTFEAGIEKTIQWYLDHEKWLDFVTRGKYRGVS